MQGLLINLRIAFFSMKEVKTGPASMSQVLPLYLSQHLLVLKWSNRLRKCVRMTVSACLTSLPLGEWTLVSPPCREALDLNA